MLLCNNTVTSASYQPAGGVKSGPNDNETYAHCIMTCVCDEKGGGGSMRARCSCHWRKYLKYYTAIVRVDRVIA